MAAAADADAPEILCPGCGMLMKANPANICVQCIRKEIDITEGIPKQAIMHYCRGCGSYHAPPNKWIQADLESKELLALTLKKLKTLNKVRLVDAAFVWTEPHSRRIKVKLTIQKEVYASMVLQQEFVVEFVVHYQQCDECQRRMAQDHWKAVVQLRQKVSHKKTFLYVEQLLIKHSAHKKCVNIKEMPDGLDFFFLTRSQGMKMLDFLNTVVPIRYKTSERLVSHDVHEHTANLKHTFSTEIVPICKEDLVCLPPKMARSHGNISQIVICSKIGNAVHLVDPLSLQGAEISSAEYWRKPFRQLGAKRDLVEMVVLDIECVGPTHGKWALADAEVARASDLGVNDKTFFVRTHLGNVLKPGDNAWGYDLGNMNWNDENCNKLDTAALPEIYLVKKAYPKNRRRINNRKWKLLHLAKQAMGDGQGRKEEATMERDYADFLDDVEEDEVMRKDFNIYKKSADDLQKHQADCDGSDDEELPEIALSEMLESLNLLDDADAGPDAPFNPFHDPFGPEEEDGAPMDMA